MAIAEVAPPALPTCLPVAGNYHCPQVVSTTEMTHKAHARRVVPLMALAAMLLPVALAWSETAKPTWDPKYEAKVGAEVAAEVEKSYDRVDNKDAIAKMQAMANVRLVKEKKPDKEPEVNAFSIPGGIIYVTQGLLNDVQSDHELAGVLAHEITHNTNYDGLTQAARASKLFKRELALVLASLVLGGLESGTWATVAQAIPSRWRSAPTRRARGAWSALPGIPSAS